MTLNIVVYVKQHQNTCCACKMEILIVPTDYFTGLSCAVELTQVLHVIHSIAKTWENVNTDHADVKELIPEFYQPPGHFLVNSMVSNMFNIRIN